jgi:hypothetical protein
LKIKINFTYYFFQTKMKTCPYCSNTYKRLNSHIGSCFQRRVMMEKQIIELQQELEQEKIKNNQSHDKTQTIYNGCTFTRNNTHTVTVNVTHTYIKDLQKNLLAFGSIARQGIEGVAHNYRGIVGARQLIKDMEKDVVKNGSDENKNILNVLQTNTCTPPEDADKEVLDESLPLIEKEVNEVNKEIVDSIVKNVAMSPQEQEEFVKETQGHVFKN